MFAQILMDIHHRKLDRVFTYAVPEEWEHSIHRGNKVEVLFSGRKSYGYVISLMSHTDYEGKISSILRIVREDVLLNEDLIHMAFWLSDESFVSLGKAFSTIFPSLGVGRMDKRIMPLSLSKKGIEAINLLRTSKTKDALLHIQAWPGKTWLDIQETTHAPVSVWQRMGREGWLQYGMETVPPNPIRTHPLNVEQKDILLKINHDMVHGVRKFLLQGVTGSGKTEIYFHLIRQAIEQGKQALVLFPEISLTEEMVSRFQKAFGNRVRPWHSQLTLLEKKTIWDDMMNHRADILIGPRSAVFVGMKSLGLVIIDEEHESSYLQNTTPCYDGRKAAMERALFNEAALIVGSATPSIETLYLVKQGQMKMYHLYNRYRNSSLPMVDIIDMREELKAGHFGIFSRRLQEEMHRVLDQKQGILLFINRRGYSGSFVCRDCGYTVMCENCDIPMTYHKEGDQLRCHYCGSHKTPVQQCPQCKSTRIRSFGIGTQKIEQEAKRLFEDAIVARIDGDVTTKDGLRTQLIDDLKMGRTDILIGTQIITKGIDFPQVGLVAVMAADLALNIPDFRAREKACQQFIQVAGRAGRFDGQGLCLIQTYQPKHISVIYGQEDRYLSFVEQELLERKRMSYPPYAQTIRILMTSEDEDKLIDRIHKFSQYIPHEPHRVLGPVPAAYTKMKNRFRWHMILLGYDLKSMKMVVQKGMKEFYEKENVSHIYFTIEVNPSSML